MIGQRATDAEWAAELTAKLPAQWQRRIVGQWQKRHAAQLDNWSHTASLERAQANTDLREMVTALDVVGIPLDATDQQVCDRADSLAALCFERSQLHTDVDTLRTAMARVCAANGYSGPGGCNVTTQGAIARMTDPLWHRRQLRKTHAKNVECAAIQLGYVNRARQKYVSDESLKRRTQQNARNLEMLEATTATNEHGDTFTLAELAAKGPANKAIRRAELMTRINGFERIANDLGHAGLFITITCPSFMHKWSTNGKGKGVYENQNYAGTTPKEAQKHLATVWARVRASLSRRDIQLYGFRIAEPNHDGTPHWHLLVFHAVDAIETIKARIRHYALEIAGHERGAVRHRVDFKVIDGRGAAGYIAKYVAKNIDGHKLQTDLCGGVELVADGMDTARRVEAWASTHGIRQFQQIGGAPIGPWRELRRVKDLPDSAPDHLTKAWRAVNKMQVLEGRENASVSWQHYTQAQGGVFCGRRYLVRITTQDTGQLGRYGEPLAPKPVGVETTSQETYTPEHMTTARTGRAPGFASRTVQWLCPSTRYTWAIGKKARASAPWTCVNNCTVPIENPAQAENSPMDTPQQVEKNRKFWAEFVPPDETRRGAAFDPPVEA